MGEEQLNIAKCLVQGVNAWVALPDDETEIRAAERQAYTLALEKAYSTLKDIRSTEWVRQKKIVEIGLQGGRKLGVDMRQNETL